MFEIHATARRPGESIGQTWIAGESESYERASAEANRIYNDEADRGNIVRVELRKVTKQRIRIKSLQHGSQPENPSRAQLMWERVQQAIKNRGRIPKGAV